MAEYELGDKAPQRPASGLYWVAPSAQAIGDVALAENASLWFGAVARGDNERITIGVNSNVQDNAVLHTDMGYPLTIGKNVTVGHGVTLHGCAIGDNCLIGIGSTILNGTRIGKNCLIGGHCFLGENKEIPDNSMVLGMPGRVVKPTDKAFEEFARASAEHYVANWKRFAETLKPL